MALKLKRISNKRNIVPLCVKFLIKLKLLIQFDTGTKLIRKNRNSRFLISRIYIYIYKFTV